MKDSAERRLTARKVTFFGCALLIFCPLLLFGVLSENYRCIHGAPLAVDGRLDVSGCDFSAVRGVPLDGTWEFFYGALIGGLGGTSTQAVLAPVPLPWNRYQTAGVALPKAGITSYRLRLTGCPPGRVLTVYIPNIDAAYRVYLDGALVSGRWAEDFDVEVGLGWKKGDSGEFRTGVAVPPSGVLQVVVEVGSSYVGGLSVTPVLVDAALDARHTALTRFLISAYVGALLLCVLSFVVLYLMRDGMFPCLAVLVLDILILIRIIMMEEVYQITSFFLIGVPTHLINAILQVLIQVLPLTIILCVRPPVHMDVSRRARLMMLLYEVFFGAAILWSALTGRPLVRHVLGLLSYLPMPYILYKMYCSVSQRGAHTLMFSAILMLSMSSIIGINLNASGLLQIDISLFAPTCFLLAVLLQLMMNQSITRVTRRRAMESEALALQLRESRLALTLSQIKPHFLYNTLIAIHMLCLEAPAEAAEAILTFSDYLRANMRSISSDKLIPFTQELSHIESYVAIEQLRFGERLAFRTELADTDFLLPPLSIQPIVENAIKHGACKNIAGGTVVLRANRVETGWRVEVSDDGPGFDPSALDEPRAESIGLANIIFRLKELRNAQVTMQSGETGTTVVVDLPKDPLI